MTTEDWVAEDSNLYQHARRELELAGLTRKDSDYNGMLGTAALEIIEVFARQGHSGQSAAIVTALINDLMQFKALTPITDDPEDWIEVTEWAPKGGRMWQCRRQSDLFSYNGGKSWHSVEDPRWQARRSLPAYLWRRRIARLRDRSLNLTGEEG